jgi:gliding motility-associated-like protein
MVLLVCDVLAANGTAIQAQALDADLTLGDGAGGGGSGGTVLLQVGMINGNLTIDAHGGSGGNVSSIAVHGPGGGGGGGVLWTSMPPGPNVTTILNGGSPGTYVQNGSNHGAEAGLPGIALSGFSVQEGAPADFDVALETTNASCDGGLGGSILVVPSGGTVPYDISWDAPLTGASFNVTDIGAGSYTFTATDANGCVNTVSTTITEDAGPTLTIESTGALCNGSANGSAQAVVTSGSAPFTYQWSPAGGTSALADGLGAGPYTCTVTDANGCSTAADVQIDEPTPVAVMASDTLICRGSSATLLAQASGGTPGYTYAWSPDGPDVVPDATASYTVIATDANGCISLPDTAVVSVPQVPQPVFAPDSSGCAPLCIPFAADPVPDLSYAWDFGDGTTATGAAPLHCYPDPGTYSVSVTVTDTNGCSNALLSQDLITVHPRPTAAFNPSATVTTLDRSTVLFTDQSTDAQSWFWEFGDMDGTTSTSTSPDFRFPAVDCYTVTLTVTNAEACTDTTSREICILDVPAVFIPNSFTPDGDGINDSFRVVIAGTRPREFELTIFNRWGGVIFSSGTPDIGWDGAGTPIGTYPWKLHYKDAEAGRKQLFGHVNLLR